MYKILTLNNLSVAGLERLPRDEFEIASEFQNPDAILLRSFKMHDMDIPDSLKAVGRAGAGTNNIPIGKMSERGIPVFNAPGANANAVKELVITGMLLAARNIVPALNFANGLSGSDAEITKAVESGKKNYVGTELPGRTLGVIGLGAIGVELANAALALGMKVIGFDPGVTVERAWQMSAGVEQAANVDDLLARADFVSLHVPLIEATTNLIDKRRLGFMKRNVTVLNFARNGIVDETAIGAALSEGRAHAYVCDFPGNTLKGHAKVIALPHLGASTNEAEENCSIMVADEVRDYLENGNIRNSVNFPAVRMPATDGCRISVANANVPNMLGQISTALADAGLNIMDMVNKSKGELAYTLVDVEQMVPDDVISSIASVKGVLKVRRVPQGCAAQ
jgi:D-3-phosphoglycerate dehydrogenase